MSSSTMAQSAGQFTKAFARYIKSRRASIIPRLISQVALPPDICGIVATFLDPSKEQFAAAVLSPHVQSANLGWDIVQHAFRPAIKFFDNGAPKYLLIDVCDLDSIAKIIHYLPLQMRAQTPLPYICVVLGIALDYRFQELGVGPETCLCDEGREFRRTGGRCECCMLPRRLASRSTASVNNR